MSVLCRIFVLTLMLLTSVLVFAEETEDFVLLPDTSIITVQTEVEAQPMDSASWESKYGKRTHGFRMAAGAGVNWTKCKDREYNAYDDFGVIITYTAGWRFNHFVYLGGSVEFEFRDRMAFTPAVDVKWTILRKPYSPYFQFNVGPYVSYDVSKKCLFFPKAGVSLRTTKNIIVHLAYGMRMFNNNNFDETTHSLSFDLEF